MVKTSNLLIAIFLHRSARIQFGGGICSGACSKLVPLRARSINADHSLYNIVTEYVMPFNLFVGPNFMFMKDSAQPYGLGA